MFQLQFQLSVQLNPVNSVLLFFALAKGKVVRRNSSPQGVRKGFNGRKAQFCSSHDKATYIQNFKQTLGSGLTCQRNRNNYLHPLCQPCPSKFGSCYFYWSSCVRLSKLLVHEKDINIIWKGPIASLNFLHFLKTNVQPIHILVSASFDGCSCQVLILAEWTFASPSVFDPAQDHHTSTRSWPETPACSPVAGQQVDVSVVLTNVWCTYGQPSHYVCPMAAAKPHHPVQFLMVHCLELVM